MGLRPLDLTDRARGGARGWELRPFDVLPREREALVGVRVESLRPGAVRGNHVHERATEWLLICGGPAVAAWRAEGGEVGRMEIPGEAPYLLEIDPGTPHAVRNDAHADLHLVAFHEERNPTTRSVDPLL